MDEQNISHNLVQKVVSGGLLNESEAYELMTDVLAGEVNTGDIESFLQAHSRRPFQVEEVSAFARAILDHSSGGHPEVETLYDICGTGGGNIHTFNISTGAFLVAAGAGVIVGKHGSGAFSSSCGSADVLAEMGVNVNRPVRKVMECVEAIGIGFVNAGATSKISKTVSEIRRRLKYLTVMNLLGPLTNPLRPTGTIVGLARRRDMEVVAEVLRREGLARALVVHGSGGMDEISMCAETHVIELNHGEISCRDIRPTTFGLQPCRPHELRGGTPAENAEILRRCLGPAQKGSTQRDSQRNAVLINAAALIWLAGRASDLEEGFEVAKEAVTSGAAKAKLEALVECSNK
jgi:anthranilate phosphoribosyltransferase